MTNKPTWSKELELKFRAETAFFKVRVDQDLYKAYMSE